VLATVAGVFFVALRTLVAAHGHIGGLVVAGSNYVSPGRYTEGVPIRAGAGYDGQFYYRLALDPLDWSRRAFGIRFDTFGRLDRVAYPAIVWLVSAGQYSAAHIMMPLVNIAALAFLAGSAAALAREAGRHAMWGLLLAGFWGFLWVLSRDLTELTEATSLVAALLAIRKARPIVAGILLAVAVLAREPALLVVGTVLLARAGAMTPWVPRAAARTQAPALAQPRPGMADAVWVIPVLAFAGWQLALRARIGVFGVLTSGQNNLGVPLAGFAGGFVHYLERLPSIASLLWVGELAVLALVGTMAAISLSKSTAALHERLAWAGSVVLAVLLVKGIWLGDVGFRSLDDFFVLSGVLLLFSRLRLDLAGLAVAGAWVVVALELVLFI